MADLPRILVIGDAVEPTGFTRVIRSVFDHLWQKFEVHQLATRFQGGSHDYPWTLYQASRGNNAYGYDQIPELIDSVKPDIVFLLYDVVFQGRYLEILRGAQSSLPIVIYSPVESGPVAPQLIQPLQGVSRYVMYTDYGRNEIEKALQQIRRDDANFRFPRLDVIPHGVDTRQFYPLSGDPAESRSMARETLGLNDEGYHDAFIVLNANRNMPRKRIDLTMQGFARFSRDKPENVKLYLHMATEDTGWNVVLLAHRYKIFDRLIMTRADNRRPELADQRLNLIYNACDTGITTTTGEGWGMVSFEHAATRAAQIVPRHTSLSELWKDAARFLEPEVKLTWPGNLTEGHFVSARGVAEALEQLYRNPSYRNRLADAAFNNATRRDYQWSNVALQWQKLFQDVIGSYKATQKTDQS